MQSPQIAFLPDGRRLHLHHGPIDLITDAKGPGRTNALRAAASRFESVLDELVRELPLLRAPTDARPNGAIAHRMHGATAPFLPAFITPMAAVAGAVADAVLEAMTAAGDLSRAYVNNGGDIALHLAAGESFTAVVAGGVPGRVTLPSSGPVRGIATSGRHGRSHSLGIADSVTVLAQTAAQADAAATLIANAVDLPGNPKITRRSAHDLSPDSDLGDRLVTTGVAPLTASEIDRALTRGHAFAETCRTRGLIHAALLTLSGQTRTLGTADLIAFKEPIDA
ncbi:UPF0280 family protein [Antarcticimicrobium sediminis]|uniref:UPF0280 family protein n=1 Tax=Antarcticimicrobium sediminis TaxID=2546227 RepID=A0A4V2Z844_9RHOB|nr:UPF0280 family protein [Antarcticimicrobium sediminis]TDE38966.1 UPF0280 family protein [Antarcticimicrobium sediminis]